MNAPKYPASLTDPATMTIRSPVSCTPSNALLAYRGLIALNNWGVSLLARRAYKAAMATFKDALRLQQVFSPLNGRSHLVNFTSQEMEDILNRARRRLVDPKSVVAPENAHIEIESISIYDLRSSTHQVLREGPSSSVFFAMRIEVLEKLNEEDFYKNMHWLLESSVLLYNFGLARLCFSRTYYYDDSRKSKRRVRKSKYHKEALQLLDLAESILDQRHSMCEAGDEDELQRILLTSLLVATNCMQGLRELGRKSLARNYYSKLMALRGAVEEVSGVVRRREARMNVLNAAAAAA